jgi:hypothetical protein
LKTPALVLLLALSSFRGIAQETVAPKPKKLQQLYFSYGRTLAFTNSRNLHSYGDGVDLKFTAGFQQNWNGRLGALLTGFRDDLSRTPNLQFIGGEIPSHLIITPYAAIGKSTSHSKIFQLKGMIGSGFTIYQEPTILGRTQTGNMIEVNASLETYYQFSLLFQAEAMVVPLRFAGLTLGGYYHFVPHISNGGFSLSLNLGRVRPKAGEIL